MDLSPNMILPINPNPNVLFDHKSKSSNDSSNQDINLFVRIKGLNKDSVQEFARRTQKFADMTLKEYSNNQEPSSVVVNVINTRLKKKWFLTGTYKDFQIHCIDKGDKNAEYEFIGVNKSPIFISFNL